MILVPKPAAGEGSLEGVLSAAPQQMDLDQRSTPLRRREMWTAIFREPLSSRVDVLRRSLPVPSPVRESEPEKRLYRTAARASNRRNTGEI